MLLRKLATIRNATEPLAVRYDPRLKTGLVQSPDGAWVPSFESPLVDKTKKADMETGEDQKGQ
jgi:hypothetical protein